MATCITCPSSLKGFLRNYFWINHVNELERQQASKHQWIPRQFYFALSATLSGRAKETLARMEKGLEKPKIQEFIPTWYHPSQQE